MTGWAEQTFQSLSLEQKLGQLMVSYLNDEKAVRDLARRGALGGLYSVGAKTVRGAAEWIREIQQESQVPLLVCSDFEYGNPFEGGTRLPSSLAVGATGNPELARAAGRMTALEAKAMGFRLMGSPVCDVNNNPNNPIINIRSYGDEPQKVSDMAVAYLQGVQDEGVFACLKHFPGHGDTDADSHRTLPVLRHELERMDEIELAPFAAGIAAGAKAVMTSHIIFSAIDSDHPATLSSSVLRGLLRENMGFRGIVLSDAMAMHAIAHNYEFDDAVGLAIRAGCDALIPSEPVRTLEALKKAHGDGLISEARVDESVMRILKAKEELSLVGSLPDPDEAERVAGNPEHAELAQRIANDSIAVFGSFDRLSPSTSDRFRKIGVIIVSNCESGGSENETWRTFESALRSKLSFGEAAVVTPGAVPEVDADRFDTIVIGLFIHLRAYNQESGRLPDTLKIFLEGILESRSDITLLAFGSPYPLAEISGLRNGLCAFDDREDSIEAATSVLFGELSAKGELPDCLKTIGHESAS